ncbi:hypothetical protein FRACYDRAFT_253526 [Fragilariopsis cylindrus CCMP1102]|uniref:Uncharacterized protein n=1 Tax=Fragilariopsis cylindrus CCMP1102 TaxID=635003 RepID=A0A1E7ELF5_9STRA|nr:hypothetical protein FRACYDRAFT_253526 [Fragilariopsis cylindrus CCMP1102]|eukprot:OEU06750.1 hypothetical protein FRACYDRAFT_253526 [Fragilariopsis cylindrus CCMP1102]
MIASLLHNQVIDHCRDRINPSHIQSLPTFTRQTTSNSKSNKQKQKQTTQHSLRQRRHTSSTTSNTSEPSTSSNAPSASDSNNDETTNTNTKGNSNKIVYMINKVLVVYNFAMVYIIMFIIIVGTAIIATERGIESMMPDISIYHHNKDGNADNIPNNHVDIVIAAAAAAAADIASTIIEPRQQLVAELVYIIMFIIIGGTAIIAIERGIESKMPDTLVHHHHRDADNVASYVDTDIAAAADIASTKIEPRQQLVAEKETLLEKLKILEDVGSCSSTEDEEDEDVVVSLALSSQSVLPLCCTIFLSIPKFLVCLLHHVRFQIFHSDATMHGALINDGDLPVILVTTESNHRIPQTKCDNDVNFRSNEDEEKESPALPRGECQNDVDFLFLKSKEGQDCAWASDGKN